MEKEQMTWDEQLEILTEKVRQCAIESPLLNAQSVGAIEGKMLVLTGELLTAALFLVSLLDLQTKAAQSNSVSPVMKEVMSYAYLATENRLMSMCEQLKVSMSRFEHFVTTTKKVGRMKQGVTMLEGTIKGMREDFDTL
jgi:hypothetical protein